MSIRSEAEENLRVIRSLMEKATVYRAISAPAALIGGLGAIIVAGVGILLPAPNDETRFIVLWLALLGFVSGVNLWLLARDAARRGEAFVSAGMRLALRAMLPGLLAGGFVAVPLARAPLWVASFWVLSYGLSLLAASHFSPKSICWLGRAFFVAGVSLFLAVAIPGIASCLGEFRTASAHGIMGATFGVFHLVYAALTWPREGAVES